MTLLFHMAWRSSGGRWSPLRRPCGTRFALLISQARARRGSPRRSGGIISPSAVEPDAEVADQRPPQRVLAPDKGLELGRRPRAVLDVEVAQPGRDRIRLHGADHLLR